jgi:hypothetical protein
MNPFEDSQENGEIQSAPEGAPFAEAAPEAAPARELASLTPKPVAGAPDAQAPRDLEWVFIGSQGLRAGWSVLIAVAVYQLFLRILSVVAVELYPAIAEVDYSPMGVLIVELIPLLAILAAGAFVARIEHRNLSGYNLGGVRRHRHFLSGLTAGFAALSVLVGALTWGRWLHFGPAALAGADIFKVGALWAAAFASVALVEEGTFRCYLQFTLARGINFWWALGAVVLACGNLAVRTGGNGAWGVYAAALLGLVPCLLLHWKKVEGSGFWQAAWVTSTLFGMNHVTNSGENWIGIFAAAAIGFVFCVSVRLTGSAWWAIGCHAAWDWSQTYFYGTADSGFVAHGHYLTTTPGGNALMSGGADGPEGSLLVLPVVLLLLAALLMIYGRGGSSAPRLERTAG